MDARNGNKLCFTFSTKMNFPKQIEKSKRIQLNIMFVLIFSMIISSSLIEAAPTGPHCFQLGQKLFGKNLDAVCVHDSKDYSKSYDVVNGNVEILTGHHDDNYLELYNQARVVTPYEDCCPPPSFTYAIQCEHIEPTGSCCYDNSTNEVKVWDVPTQTGCIHSVEDYASYPMTEGQTSTEWNTSNPEVNTHVEVYASLHPNGCCECFMYALECSPCN